MSRQNSTEKFLDTDLWVDNYTWNPVNDYPGLTWPKILNPSLYQRCNFVCNPNNYFPTALGSEYLPATVVANGRCTYGLNKIFKGTDNYNRIGTDISLLSVSLKLGFYTAYNYTTATDVDGDITLEAYQQNNYLPAKIRVLLVYDKQPQVPVYALTGVSYGENLVLPDQVLRCRADYPDPDESYPDIGQYSWSWNNAHLNLDYAARFEVLADEFITLNPYGSGETVQYINKYYDLKERISCYNSQPPFNCTYGFLGLLVLSDQGSRFNKTAGTWDWFNAGCDFPRFWWNGTTRVRFRDH